MTVTKEFINQHQARINEVDLQDALMYIDLHPDKIQKDLLGVLYAPIMKDEWTQEALLFCGKEMPKDEVTRLAFWFIKEQLDDSDIIESNQPYRITALNDLDFSLVAQHS